MKIHLHLHSARTDDCVELSHTLLPSFASLPPVNHVLRAGVMVLSLRELHAKAAKESTLAAGFLKRRVDIETRVIELTSTEVCACRGVAVAVGQMCVCCHRVADVCECLYVWWCVSVGGSNILTSVGLHLNGMFVSRPHAMLPRSESCRRSAKPTSWTGSKLSKTATQPWPASPER